MRDHALQALDERSMFPQPAKGVRRRLNGQIDVGDLALANR
jgi:hypothetical protein